MAVFLFSGHMIDAPSRENERFPASLENAVQAAIADKLDHYGASPSDIGFGSAACGSDLLFAEGLLQRGATLRLCLAFPVSKFINTSVAFAGVSWVRRFRDVIAHAQVNILPSNSQIALNTSNPYERTNIWLLEKACLLGGRNIVFLCVWDGQGGDGPGGTAHMVKTIEKTGGIVDLINPREL